MNGDPDTAADITQDVFLKLLENIQSVRKIGKFQNYLLTIAVNTCNNYTKKAKPLYMDLETLEDIEDTDNAFEKIELNELKAQIQYAINTLPDYQKEVIILRFYYDLLTMQEKIDQAKQATVGQDENSAFSAVHVYRDQAAILEYLTNSDGSFKSLETAYPNSPTVTLGYCDGWDKLLSGMGSILSIMICLIVVITLSPVFSEEYALHTDSIIYSARYGRTKLTTSKIIAALEVVIGTYLLYLLLNLVLYGCTYGLQGWNVSIQSSLHYASSIYNLTFLQMFFISVILNIFGIVALTTITLFLSAQMSSPVTALITSCVICFLPVVFDFNDSLPVLQKMQEICPIFMLHTNGIFSDMKTYFGMSQPVFMIILNVGLIFVFYRLTKNISKKHQVTG